MYLVVEGNSQKCQLEYHVMEGCVICLFASSGIPYLQMTVGSEHIRDREGRKGLSAFKAKLCKMYVTCNSDLNLMSWLGLTDYKFTFWQGDIISCNIRQSWSFFITMIQMVIQVNPFWVSWLMICLKSCLFHLKNSLSVEKIALVIVFLQTFRLIFCILIRTGFM